MCNMHKQNVIRLCNIDNTFIDAQKQERYNELAR